MSVRAHEKIEKSAKDLGRIHTVISPEEHTYKLMNVQKELHEKMNRQEKYPESSNEWERWLNLFQVQHELSNSGKTQENSPTSANMHEGSSQSRAIQEKMNPTSVTQHKSAYDQGSSNKSATHQLSHEKERTPETHQADKGTHIAFLEQKAITSIHEDKGKFDGLSSQQQGFIPSSNEQGLQGAEGGSSVPESKPERVKLCEQTPKEELKAQNDEDGEPSCQGCDSAWLHHRELHRLWYDADTAWFQLPFAISFLLVLLFTLAMHTMELER